jgi:hypothetical protein
MSVEILGMRKRRHKKYFRHNSTLALRTFDALVTKNLKKAIRKRNERQKMRDNNKYTKLKERLRTRVRMMTITLFECSFPPWESILLLA